MKHKSHKEIIEKIFYAALKAVDPYESVRCYKDTILSICRENNSEKLLLVGFGKAASQMARAVEDFAGDLIKKGILITKYGHSISQESRITGKESKIKIYEAGHPLPDGNGLAATKEIIDLVKGLDENSLLLCLISGGGSALFVSPYNDVSLDDKKKTTELLLKAGADIKELNTVRKHISAVKGGRLAELAYPARIISLILSDVIGDKLDVIASGPTSPDETTFGDTLEVIERYNLSSRLPQKVLEVLHNGASGSIRETPKEGNCIFDRVENIIIGSNRKALKAAKTQAEFFGLKTEILSSEISGEARDVGKSIAREAMKAKNTSRKNRDNAICFISGGETTVTVRGTGLGGRNMELALSFAIGIEGTEGITMLSAGTDGTDGPTDAAGAIVNSETMKTARANGLDPVEYLENNDSYNFFKQIDGLLITGPTGTNVMDIQILIVE
jgi:glycerate 2-kinase